MTFSSIGDPNRKIKVLHLITSLEVGGAQYGLLLGLPRFNSEKYEHIVCSLMDRIQMAEQFQQAGIEVRSLGLKTKIDFSVAIRLRSLLKEVKPDVLHTYLLHSNVLGRIVGRLTGVPTIIGSERTIGQARYWGRLLTKLTNPLTDAVEVNSQTGAIVIEDSLGVPREKIELVKSGVNLDEFSKPTKGAEIRTELGLIQDQHLVLYVGRLRPVKGVEFGIRAFALVKNKRPNLYMALAGEGEQLCKLQNLVNDLGINNHVKFLGVRNDLPDLLAAADSILIPSLNEGFPRTAIEAMAAGKPIVATRVGGIPEAIIDGKTGILVPAKDIPAMAEALISLIDDALLRERLGAAGAKLAKKNYSINNYVNRLNELYYRLSGIDGSTLSSNTPEEPLV
jgi:glycosyltransferase involved in cell wall biosynthesis